MAQIPSGYLRSLTDAISKLSQDAQAVALPKLNEMVASGNYAEPYDLVDDLIEYLEPILSALTGNSAALTANAYDLLRMAAIDAPMGAEPYPAHDPEVTKKALYGMAGQHRSSFNGFVDAVMRRIDYEAKLASGTTMTSNGARDSRRPRFARVPQGPTTCPFCLMLASRGFVYYSEESGGKVGDLNRFHENCDCRVVPQWGGESYEGYDPDEYDRQYRQLMDDGKLDTEQLARASEKAKQRRR